MLRVHPRLQEICNREITFCEKFLGLWNTSNLDYVHINPGRDRSRSVNGKCHFPHKETGKGYRITCNIALAGGFPRFEYVRLKPIYYNGQIPKLEGIPNFSHFYYGHKNGKKWMTPLIKFPVQSPGRALIWIFGHEVFHWLRHSKQVEGRNVEWQADLYGMFIVDLYGRDFFK